MVLEDHVLAHLISQTPVLIQMPIVVKMINVSAKKTTTMIKEVNLQVFVIGVSNFHGIMVGKPLQPGVCKHIRRFHLIIIG